MGRATHPWQPALAMVVLLPGLALAHARLVSPSPRTTTIGKTPPCAGAARTSTPTVLVAGQMLEVDWVETVDHPGHFELAISPSDDLGFVTLLGNIADHAFATGATERAYSTTLHVPETPCDGCTLQLIQFMSDHPPGSQYYYSCADIRIVASGSPTTTLPAGSTTTTTSTTLPSGCESLEPSDRARCLMGALASQPACDDARAERALRVGLTRIATLLDETAAPGTAGRRVGRLLAAARHRLAKMRRRIDAAGRSHPSPCSPPIPVLLAELRAAIAAIGP